jgi:two-component system, chemotaxis family, protein-glutamate methylesterase/glutaminase
MPGHDIVVIGFSAGGIDPLLQLVAALPDDIPAAIFVVHHFPAQSISALPTILTRATDLGVVAAADGTPIVPGRVYVGIPDHHLLVQPGRVRVTRGPREHGHRPAVDPLLRSAARSYGPRVIGVILSGTLDDGTAGLYAIKTAGGLTVVQEPEDCAYPGMPRSALELVPVDFVAPAHELGALIDRLVRTPAPDSPRRRVREDEVDHGALEAAIVGTAALRESPPPGRPANIVCPECGGALSETEDGELLHFRCHIGHAYSEASLLAKQSDALESALWSAVRALEEKAELARRLAERMRARGMARTAAQFADNAHDAEQGSAKIRDLLLKGPLRDALDAPAELDSPAPEPGAKPHELHRAGGR